jgi:16S rRNA A1518/A1519 N6-dimethyltransferase RsmA/KsgA/DIM1 with predicted DNA glycosylase/AP lyase activity
MPRKQARSPKPDLRKDQAFMVDTKAIKWIIRESGLKRTDTVLEIGAGTGNLTTALAKSGARVIAVENDISMESELVKRLQRFRNVEVVIGNALKLLDSKGIKFDKIISNIPYAISEPLIRRLIFHDFSMGVLTLPKSFAHRLVAASWEKQYSTLSFTFQMFFIVHSCLDLQRDSFRPAPKTNSVVMKFVTKPKNSVTCQLLLRQDMSTKNALREALCSVRKCTKNQARERIKSIEPYNLLERKVSELSTEDIKTIVKKVSEHRNGPPKKVKSIIPRRGLPRRARRVKLNKDLPSLI